MRTHANKSNAAAATPEAGRSFTPSRPNTDHNVRRAWGNRMTERLLNTRLEVGPQNDRHEQEANEAGVRSRGDTKSAATRAGHAAASTAPRDVDDRAFHKLPGSLAPGPGRPLPERDRGPMESMLGHDFSGIRIHDDSSAHHSAKALNAQAYTLGRHIVFGAQQYAPQLPRGRELLSHELTHVVQQAQGGSDRAPRIQRRVTDQYSTIEDRLSYGIIDWAITDSDARDVLDVLNGLSERDLADTAVAMERDGLFDRLLDNISGGDQESFAVLIGRLNRYRPTHASFDRIEDRLSYGLFDWAITDRDAHDVLTVLMGLGFQQLRAMVAKMINEGFFDRLMDNISGEDQRRFAAFIQRLRNIADEFRSLVSTHLAFLRRPRDPADPTDSGTAGGRIRRTVRTTGYGGQTPEFGNLPAERQREWRERAARAIAAVQASVRGTHLGDILDRSTILFDPEGAERLGTRPGREAYAFVPHGASVLHVGRSWVRDVEENVRNVWQSIAHELGGHHEFGFTWSYQIMEATTRQLSAEERREAFGTVRSLFSAYGYLETELYAELREFEFRLPTSGGDRPQANVPQLLRRVLAAFGPTVGREIIVRFYYRVAGDVRITAESKRFLYDSVQSAVPGGLFPLTRPVGP